MNFSFLTSSNRLVYVLGASIALLVFLSVILILRSFGGGGEHVVLQFWGVFDDRNAFAKAIRAFESQNPGIKIIYTKINFEDYEKNLVDALAAGRGPDILMIHNTWLPKHGDKLRPLPSTLKVQNGSAMTLKGFRDQFVDVAFQDFVAGNQIYAMPLYADTVALYYNKDLLNGAGIATPPRTWEEFNSVVELLTKLDASGNIAQSGAAIGSARNINRSTDILMALMLQSGVQMTDRDNSGATFTQSVDNQRVGEVALQYYTDFTNRQKRTYCWNDSLHYSIDAFAEGTTAMMFNYAHQLDILRGKSSRLNFGVAPMPQLNNDFPVTYANYWAPAVALGSQYPDQAWRFIAFLTAQDNALEYLSETRRPAARRDIVDLQRNDLDLGVFAEQALSARSWYQVDSAAIEGIFADMIDNVNLGRLPVRDALQNAESRVNVLMQRRR